MLGPGTSTINAANLRAMHPIAAQIDHYSRRCYDEQAELEHLSPYTPLSLYQAAVVHSRLYRLDGHSANREALLSLEGKLRFFARRWASAGKLIRAMYYRLRANAFADLYLAALEADEPPLLSLV